MRWVVRIPSRNPGEWTYLGQVLGQRREALAITHAVQFETHAAAKAELSAWLRGLAYCAPEVAGTLPARLRDADLEPVPDGAMPSPSEAVPASRHPDAPRDDVAVARSAPPSEPPTGLDHRSAVVGDIEARWREWLAEAERGAAEGADFTLTCAEMVSVLRKALLIGRVVRNAHRGRWHGPRWAHVKAVTALGSTEATSLCREYGLEPHEIVGISEDIGADDAF
jgi:hypothetical protein